MRHLALALSFVLATASAAAQSTCFTLSPTQRAPSTHLVVGPASQFDVNPQCRYGVRARGASELPTQTLTAGARDAAEFFAELNAPAGALASNLEIVAINDATPPQVETLTLRPCITELGEGDTVVRFEPSGARVRVSARTNVDRCPVNDAELVLLRTDSDASTLRGATPEGARVVALSNTSEALFDGDHSAWAAFVRRRGSNAAVRIDTLRFGDPRTALRRRFEAPGDHPWFRGEWSGGSLRLTPDRSTFLVNDIAWPELVTASSTHAVFVATHATAEGADITPLPFDVDGSAVLAPEVLVRDAMRARYGSLGPSFVPVRGDWTRALRDARVCHRETYSVTPDRSARVTNSQLTQMRCVSLAQVTALAPDALAPATIERRVDAISVRDTVSIAQSPDVDNESLPLEGDGRVRFVTPGDTLRAPATLPGGRALSLCRIGSDAQTGEPIALAASASHVFDESAAGLWQLVLRPQGEPACTGHDLALARIAVVAPRTQWIPVGLQEHGEMDLRDPWRSVETSGDDSFAFHARSGVPEFRVSMAPEVSAAVNGWQPDATDSVSDEPARIGNALPVVLPNEPALSSPAPSALAVLLSTEDQCPVDGRGLLANLRGLPAESVFHAYLVARNAPGDAHRFTCLSRATLRVVPPLVHRGSTAGPFYVRWGTPGAISARASWEVLGECSGARCLSLGVSVPLIYARISPASKGASWVGMEFSLPLVIAASPGDGRALHTGLGLDVAFTLGPFALPRLVTLGVLFAPTFVNVAPSASTSSFNIAPYLGINLNSIVDAIRSE